MSYILDALRKADAERERGNVPGINAQPMFGAAPPRSAPPASRPWWAWLIAGVVVILALAVAALLWRLNSTSSARTSGEQTGAGPASAPTAVFAASGAAPAVTAVPPAVASQPEGAKQPIAREAPVVHKPKPAETPASKSLLSKPPTQSAQTSNAVPGSMSGTAPKSQGQEQARSAAGALTSTSGESHVYTVNELPEDIRRQLPALAVGASIYSNTPANRILIINGQVLHEGETVISGLVLEQIKLKAAVLAFKGFRFIITY
jgi:general secretion pathway protein B